MAHRFLVERLILVAVLAALLLGPGVPPSAGQLPNGTVAAPTVSISASPTTVAAGEPFSLIVSGASSVGLHSAWWYGGSGTASVDGVNITLGPAQGLYIGGYYALANGATNHTYTKQIIISTPGTYTLSANSRDILYPVAGEPHQASEGMGIQSVTITVTAASTLRTCPADRPYLQCERFMGSSPSDCLTADDWACCGNNYDCVTNGICYKDHFKATTTPACSPADTTGGSNCVDVKDSSPDIEMCGDSLGYNIPQDMTGKWVDQDFESGQCGRSCLNSPCTWMSSDKYCEQAYRWGSSTDGCDDDLRAPPNDPTGKEYCCGDDPNEYYKTGSDGTKACCAASDRTVVAGICSPPEAPCTDDCSSSGTNTCSGTSGYKTCGNYDSDACLEWSGVTGCASGTTCGNGTCAAGESRKLLAYWPFDEGTGTIANDESGNDHDGTIYGGGHWTTGISGTALDFRRGGIFQGDDYITAPNVFNSAPKNLTVMAWVKPIGSFGDGIDSDMVIVSQSPQNVGCSGEAFALWLDGRDLFYMGIWTYPSTEAHANNDIPPSSDEWTHVTGTYDGSTIKMYVDGELKGTTSRGGTLCYLPNGTFSIGRKANGGYWNGLIDEIRIYNYALSASEVQQEYAVHAPSTCTNDCSPSGTKTCSGTTGTKTCGNYDSDSCLEWSGVTTCQTGQTCSSGSCSTPVPQGRYLFCDSGDVTNLGIAGVDNGWISSYGWSHSPPNEPGQNYWPHFIYDDDSQKKGSMALAYLGQESVDARDYAFLPSQTTKNITAEISFYDPGSSSIGALLIMNLMNEEPETYIGVMTSQFANTYTYEKGPSSRYYNTGIQRCSGCWVKLMMWYDGSLIHYYIDGQEVGSLSYTGGVDSFWINALATTTAYFDDFTIWTGGPNDRPSTPCAPTPSCTSDCSPSGTKTCSGTSGYKTCGNYDSDSCLEWSGVTGCASGQTCSSGACVTLLPNETRTCPADKPYLQCDRYLSSSPGDCFTAADWACCPGNYDCVYKGVCYKDHFYAQCNPTSTTGNSNCVDTNDKSSDVEVCGDSWGYTFIQDRTGKWGEQDFDSGTCGVNCPQGSCKWMTSSTYCEPSYRWQSNSDGCDDDLTPSHEDSTGKNYCCGDDQKEYYKTGTDGTKACCAASDRVVHGGICYAPAMCTDSDGGLDYDLKGTVTAGNQTYADACINTMDLSEKYCEGDAIVREGLYVCPYGCVDGACVAQQANLTCRQASAPCTTEEGDCCAGLVKVPYATLGADGLCIAANCGTMCRPCGNGVCDANENACNCAPDCAQQEKADLTVTGISFSPAEPHDGETVAAAAEVLNSGKKASGYVNVKWYVDGVQSGYESFGPLQPGATTADYSHNVRLETKLTAGIHTLSFVIDADNHENESDETNNRLNKTIRVLPPAEGLKADLAVTDIDVSPSEPQDGDKVFVTATVRNLGAKASGHVASAWYLDGTSAAGLQIGPLGAGESLAVKERWVLTEGLHTVAFEADTTNRENESDETNNRLGKTIVVSEAGPCKNQRLIILCHQPGTPAQQELCVAPEAVEGHIGHGDYLGQCLTKNESSPGERERGTKAAEVRFSQVFIDMEPDTQVEVVMNRPDTDIQRITFTQGASLAEAKIHFKTQEQVPEDVPLPPGRGVSSYMVIEHPEIENELVADATLEFKVGKGWLAQSGFALSDVALTRFADGAWHNLATRHLRSDGVNHYFAAESSGLSVFAVVIKEPSASTAEPGPSPQLGDRLQSMPRWLFYALGGAVLIGLLIPRKHLRRRRQKPQAEEEQ